MEKIAVLDSGGQYCHLIARKVRELGVYAEILPVSAAPAKLERFKGIVLSGGPASVFADESPQPDSGLFQLDKPMLGICYGHQLMARYLGGTVERGETHEFGSADLRIRKPADLFAGLAGRQRVWMSHGDRVSELPPGFAALADTLQCGIAAMARPDRGLYGIQFHPEVAHTPNGLRMLCNFLEKVCGCRMDWRPRDRIEQLKRSVREQANGRRVLFFLSGGVDSMVAYTLTVQAVGSESAEAVYVDTGFMRSGETAEIEAAFRAMNLGKLQVVEASKMFLGRLQDVIDPEEKRAVIGKAFVDLQDEILAGERFRGHDWMLGQGTIYPDTIESGGTQSAAVIKTHHNRVERIQELIDEGRVLEPLAEFYKDEVRELGRALGLAPRLLARHPFPGPGLAIRCICNGAAARPEPDAEIAAVAEQWGYRSFLLPLRSVGVQGDSRSYAKLTVLHDGPLLPAATAITNAFRPHQPHRRGPGAATPGRRGLENRAGFAERKARLSTASGRPHGDRVPLPRRAVLQGLAMSGGAAAVRLRRRRNHRAASDHVRRRHDRRRGAASARGAARVGAAHARHRRHRRRRLRHFAQTAVHNRVGVARAHSGKKGNSRRICSSPG